MADLKPLQLPVPIRVWNTLGRSFSSSEISVQPLLDTAAKAEGLDDFGDDYFLSPLNRLVQSINEEAKLHAFGRFVTRKRLVGLLRNRLRAEYYFRKFPEILEIDLTPPLVIAGLQRTGTTFLQRLIAMDPDVRALRSWEALNPAPFIGWDREKKDKRIAEGKQAEKGLRYLNPSFFAIHPVEYNAPEEEVLLLDVSFLSTVAEATLSVPGFSKWLEVQDQTPAYQYMKKLLQLLLWQKPGNRWVLKTPHHLEYLDTLRSVFPGCTIVQTHRDPALTVPSLCSMLWHGRFIFSSEVDPVAIGRSWFEKIELMLRKAKTFRDSVAGNGFIDVQYVDLIANPSATVNHIYQAAGLEMTFEQQLKDNLGTNRKDKYGVHRYKPEDFGLSEEEIRNRLAPYLSI